MAENLARPFVEHARRAPERLALSVEDERIAYGELADRCGRLAGYLRDAVGEDANEWRVAVLTSRSATAYASILGTVWAGGTYVPINAKLPEDRLISLLERARCSVLLADEAGARRLSEAVLARAPRTIVAPRAAVDASAAAASRIVDWSTVLDHAPLVEPVPVAASRTAYVLFTSGTTGIPKGVMISTGSVGAFLATMRRQFSLSSEDRFSQHAELTFDLSVFDQFACWASGASLHVVPDGQRMAPLRFINEHAITVWMSVPSVITFVDRMKMLGPGVLPTLRVSIFCGEALPTTAARAWRAATPNGIVENHYGPTEATVTITGQPVTDSPRATEERGCIAIGPVYSDQYAAIIDAEGKFLPAGERGELALAGSQLMTGYFDDEELTARRCPVLDHPELGRMRWYRSGDLACMDADGTFHHLGRIDNQIKLNGHRIELEDIESHLRTASSASTVCAVAWPIENGVVQGITAFVAGTSLTRKEILDRLKTRVPEYMVPKGLFLVEDLPLSANGKVDRKALTHRLAGGASAV